MKKLLCVLMFGMVFGQAELTTRVYDHTISIQDDELLNFTLSNITNGELDNSQNAFIRILDVYDCSIESATKIYLKIKYEGGGSGYWMLSNVNACFNYNCAEN